MPDANDQVEDLKVFIPLLKVDAEKRLVYGCIACEEPDISGEIMDYDSAKLAFQKWSGEMSKASGGDNLGNVREMHSRSAAGKLVSIDFDDANKKIFACAKVVDDKAWEKVQEGVYTGFSPGGGYAKIWNDSANPKMKRYTPAVIELSLVDKPCMKSATFEYIKAAGEKPELRKFASVIMDDLEQGFRAKDGTFFLTAAQAKAHNTKLAKAAETVKPSEAQATLAELSKQVGELEKGAATAPAEDKPAGSTGDKIFPRFKRAAGTPGEVLRKSMLDVARCAEILDSLMWLQDCISYEAKVEGDMAPGDLCNVAKALAAGLSELLAHEVKEMTASDMGKVAEGLTLEKAARAALSKFAPLEKILAVVKEPEPEKNPEMVKLAQALDTSNGELAKVREVVAAKEKELSELGHGLTELKKRLEVIERQPVPPRGVLRPVDREAERRATNEQNRQNATEEPARRARPDGLSPRDARAWDANETDRINNFKKH